ncbi:MAG: DUF3108 domain-containing protein [Bdellovibrionales bacterium]|nr:DUF3108 domain-containing protein [Bdellovibrionales bacterium]
MRKAPIADTISRVIGRNLALKHVLTLLKDLSRPDLATRGLSFCLGVVCLLLSVTATPVFSEEKIPLDEIRIKTPHYVADQESFHPSLGVYEYKTSWQGIGAATLKVYVDQVEDYYHIVATAKTNKFVDLFYRLRYQALGVISTNQFTPINTSIQQQENSKVKQTQINYLPDGRVLSVNWRKGKDVEQIEFDPKNEMLEPFAAAFLARSLDWPKGTVRRFDTFDGKNRYLLKLSSVDEIEMKINGEPRKVWVISPYVKKLATNKKHDKLREARIYVTADEQREVLQIVSEVFVGSVKTQLVSFTPKERYLAGSSIAWQLEQQADTALH